MRRDAARHVKGLGRFGGIVLESGIQKAIGKTFLCEFQLALDVQVSRARCPRCASWASRWY